MTSANMAIIKSVLDADASLTPEQRQAALDALASATSSQPAAGRPSAVIKWRDAADRLGITRQAVHRIAKRGGLNPVSINGIRAYGVTADSLEAFIASRTRTGKAYTATTEG